MANQDDLQAHLNSSIYGPPQTNPDERHQYLGSLRERAVLLITNADLAQPATLAAFRQAFPRLQQPTYTMLLNGKLDTAVTAPYLAAAAAAHFRFTLVNDDNANTAPQGCGLLIAAPQAVNQADISLPQPAGKTTPPPKKKGFLHKLF